MVFPHPRHVPVAPVLRRPSPLDPPAGAWAVIGMGAHGRAVTAALTAADVPVLGYDLRPDPAEDSLVRWGHRVIAIEEIEDIDALAVTSRDDVAHEITSEYVAGVVICVGAYDDWDFVDPELLNVVTGAPVLAHRMFTPRHPAVVVSGPEADAGLARQAQVIAAYAGALRRQPRRALSFHRRACARLLPGFPRVAVDPVADRDYDEVLAADLRSLAP